MYLILDEIIKKMPCKHIFHRECIKQWFKSNHTCPVCRADIEQMLDKQIKEKT